MAELRKIVIEIVGKTNGDNKEENEPTKENDEVNNEVNYLLHPIKSIEKATVGKSVLVNQAYQQAKSSIKQYVQFSVNRYFNLKEDYLNETKVNNIMTSVSKVESLATAVGAGLAVGGGVGVLFTTAGWAISQAISYQSRLSSYYQTLNATNQNTEFARTRAGLTNDSKGTEN